MSGQQEPSPEPARPAPATPAEGTSGPAGLTAPQGPSPGSVTPAEGGSGAAGPAARRGVAPGPAAPAGGTSEAAGLTARQEPSPGPATPAGGTSGAAGSTARHGVSLGPAGATSGAAGLTARQGVAPGPAAPAGATSGAAGPTARRPRLVNPANALTLLRLVLVPFFIVLLTGGSGARIAAFVLFGVASLTDLLDGRLARQRGQVTDFGKIADPVADKALTGAAFVTLSALGHLSWWVTAVILVRELGVTALRMMVIRRNVIAASRGGKLKTLLQVIAISLYVLPGPFGLARPVVMGLAVAVTLVTGVDYVLTALRKRP